MEFRQNPRISIKFTTYQVKNKIVRTILVFFINEGGEEYEWMNKV